MTIKQAPKALLYVRVSTARQAAEGISLEGQERTLREAAEKAGYECELFTDGGKSGKSMSNRLALQEALKVLNAGGAEVLYVAKLERLARSVQDFHAILAMSAKYGWRLIALDGSIDTATPAGKFMTTIYAGFAELESGIKSERQKENHATRRAQGVRWGVDKGNAPETAPEIRARIITLNAQGVSLNQIARDLNAEGVPTTRGGAKWYASTVRGILKSPSLNLVA
jgi:DNA invertase Pin-like site-specific DNA recombinase